MDEGYLGSIMAWAPNYAPQGWMFCDGSLLPIQQYTALFALLGNTFGGDGRTNFALPDLRGRGVVGAGVLKDTGTVYPIGSKGGSEIVPLQVQQIPQHNHLLFCNNNSAAQAVAAPGPDSILGVAGTGTGKIMLYDTYSGNPADLTPLHANSIAISGGGKGHNNMQPFAVLNYIICCQGYFPPRP